MKCLEPIVIKIILTTCEPLLDSWQIVYKTICGLEDAILYFIYKMYHNLGVPKCYVRTLTVDFSSAFNTMQTHILTTHNRLDMGLSQSITLWILDFLTNGHQFVRLMSGNDTYN